MADPLVELMQAPACRPLLDRLRKKLERGEALTGRCRLTRLTPIQRDKISELMGTRSRGKWVSVDLDAFSQIVGNTGRFSSLRELIERVCGQKIEDLRARRDGHTAAWNETWKVADDLVARAIDPNRAATTGSNVRRSLGREILQASLRDMRRTGWLRRLTKSDHALASRLLDQAFCLLRTLPVPPTPLAIFAAKHCGDAHALDGNQSLGRLLFRLISSERISDAPLTKTRAIKRRGLWESVGIVPDELSSSVLVLNLRATGDSLSDLLLRQHRRVGMPCRMTFRHLRLEPPHFAPLSNSGDQRPIVYVCENPSVLAAAAETLGAQCPAMICVEGYPSLTCWSVLGALCDAGYRLKYHGDFDWGGIRIANKIYEAFGFQPWRFEASDHRVTSGAHRKLRPPVAEAIWDAEISAKIRLCGVAVEEESMIEDLIHDLSPAT